MGDGICTTVDAIKDVIIDEISENKEKSETRDECDNGEADSKDGITIAESSAKEETPDAPQPSPEVESTSIDNAKEELLKDGPNNKDDSRDEKDESVEVMPSDANNENTLKLSTDLESKIDESSSETKQSESLHITTNAN